MWSLVTEMSHKTQTTDTEIVLGSSLGLSRGHCGSMALGHLHGPMWWPRLQTFACPLVVTRDTNINTGPLGCFGASDKDLTHTQTSPWTWVASSLSMSACSSPPSPLQIHPCSQSMNIFFLFHFTTLYSLTIMVPDSPGDRGYCYSLLMCLTKNSGQCLLKYYVPKLPVMAGSCSFSI